jgi:hypothetical protein
MVRWGLVAYLYDNVGTSAINLSSNSFDGHAIAELYAYLKLFDTKINSLVFTN